MKNPPFLAEMFIFHVRQNVEKVGRQQLTEASRDVRNQFRGSKVVVEKANFVVEPQQIWLTHPACAFPNPNIVCLHHSFRLLALVLQSSVFAGGRSSLGHF